MKTKFTYRVEGFVFFIFNASGRRIKTGVSPDPVREARNYIRYFETIRLNSNY